MFSISLSPNSFILPSFTFFFFLFLIVLQLIAIVLLLKHHSISTLGFSLSQFSHCIGLLAGLKMTLKGATSQACAACKYQRRKCTPECLLAPYFPPDQPYMFKNAHKLFGVSNILKILKNLNPRQKMEAMTSIIYEANMRDKFRVHGCCEVIYKLQCQILLAEEELQAVHSQLAMYRQHHHQQIASMPEYIISQLELGMAPPNNPLPLFNHNPEPYNNNHAVPALQVHQQQSYSNSSDAAYIEPKGNINNNAANAIWFSNDFTTNDNNTNNSEAIQSQLGVLQPLSIQPEVVQDCDELHPIFDTIDDRQSYIDSKEAYESSSEESFKDTPQSMGHAENALKNAAACFSLTSVN